MVYGIYSSATGMMASQYRQDVLANNLANVSTAGFKQDLTVVRERMPEALEAPVDSALSDPTLAGLTGGVLVAPTYTSWEPGPVETTGNPLDAAITGKGFFHVRAGGTDRYTRDGRFTLSEQGELVTVTGQAHVLDVNGEAIVAPKGYSGRVQVNANGEVLAGKTVIGQIAVVDFADNAVLRKTGGNLMRATGGERPAAIEANLRTGAYEGSNVDPTRAMVAMLEVTRAYQLNSTMVTLADQTLGRAVNDIARLK